MEPRQSQEQAAVRSYAKDLARWIATVPARAVEMLASFGEFLGFQWGLGFRIGISDLVRRQDKTFFRGIHVVSFRLSLSFFTIIGC